MSAAAVKSAGVVRLDARRARALTTKLRETLDLAVELVRELHEHEGWRALGYDSWPAFCAAELPQLAVIVRGMPRGERDGKLSELRSGGMSLRDVSAATGVAPNTVRTATRGVELAVVKSRDGALRPATARNMEGATRAKRVHLTDRLVGLVRDAGPEGITVLELCDRARVRQARVAPALVRLDRAGRLTYSRPEKRGQLGRYVIG